MDMFIIHNLCVVIDLSVTNLYSLNICSLLNINDISKLFLKKERKNTPVCLFITLPFLISFKVAINIYKVKWNFWAWHIKSFCLPVLPPLLLLFPCTFLFQAFHAAWLICVYVFVHVLFSLPKTACQNHLLKDFLFCFQDSGLKCPLLF